MGTINTVGGGYSFSYLSTIFNFSGEHLSQTAERVAGVYEAPLGSFEGPADFRYELEGAFTFTGDEIDPDSVVTFVRIARHFDQNLMLMEITDANIPFAAFANPYHPGWSNEAWDFTGRGLYIGGAQDDTILTATDSSQTNRAYAGMAGDDLLRGGTLSPIKIDYRLERGGAGVAVDLENNTATDTYGDQDTLVNVGMLIGTEFNDVIIGDGRGDYVGGAGDDRIDGGAKGPGDGDAWVRYDEERGAGGVTVNLRQGTATDTYGDQDTLTNIDAVYGSGQADMMIGGDAGDRFRGQDGDDRLIGGGGDDALFGGFGSDKIRGDGGDDIIYGGGGDDLLSGGAGDDLLTGETDDDIIRGDGGDDQLLGGRGEDTLRGGTGDDRIYGDSDDDMLFGNAGRDELHGGFGDDQLNGGGGGDKLWGWSGSDRMFGGGGDDEMFGEDGADFLAGGAGGDIIVGGWGDDLIFGNADNDTLFGEAGDDRINGGGGDDFLRGGQGDDELVGGAGADEFRYANSIFGADVIRDFENGADHFSITTNLAASFNDISVEQSGDDTILRFGQGSVTLLNVSATSITGDDFIFG